MNEQCHFCKACQVKCSQNWLQQQGMKTKHVLSHAQQKQITVTDTSADVRVLLLACMWERVLQFCPLLLCQAIS